MQVLWFIPTHGDGRYLASAKGGRATGFRYLRALAQAVDDLGFAGALLPTGRSCDDAWVAASMLASVTDRMRFLVAVRPGLVSPTAAARMAASFDRLSDGRLLINVVTGGDPVELAGDGIFHGHDQRYALTDEFLHVWRRLFRGETVDFQGEHLRVEGARLLLPGLQKPHPPLWFGGSSPAGLEIAGRHVDVSLTWAEPPAAVAEKIAAARAAAARHGRTLGFGIRLHVIVRETEAEAWAAADDLIRFVTDDAVAEARRTFARFDSEGQRRMSQLQAANGRPSYRREALEISPNLWAGVGLVRGGAGTALVGDPATVARRLLEYRELGIETFILSGYPHLEEAYRCAELLFPLLPLAGGPPASAVADLPQYLSPFGEVAAAPVTAAGWGDGRVAAPTAAAASAS